MDESNLSDLQEPSSFTNDPTQIQPDLVSTTVTEVAGEKPELLASITNTEEQSQATHAATEEPLNPIANKWLNFIKSRFQEADVSSSFVFDWHLRRLIHDIQENNFKTFLMIENPDKNQQDIFKELSKAHFKTQKKNFTTDIINGEKVLFLTSFDLSNGFISDWQPDRIAILRSPESLPHDIRKASYQELSVQSDIEESVIKRQANGLTELTNYIQSNKIPVHIMGKCDYLCSAHVMPSAHEIYIEPFGEILFNGNPFNTYHILNNLMSVIPEIKDPGFRDRIIDQDPTVLGKHIQKLSYIPLADSFFQFLEAIDTPSSESLMNKIEATLVNPAADFYTLWGGRSFSSSLVQGEWNTVAAFLIDIPTQNIAGIKDAATTYYNSVKTTRVSSIRESKLAALYGITGLLTHSAPVRQLFHLYPSATINPYPFLAMESVDYTHISPRSVFLRKLGFNVEGNNSGLRDYILPYRTKSKMSILPITETTLNKCRFKDSVFISQSSLECAAIRNNMK